MKLDRAMDFSKEHFLEDAVATVAAGQVLSKSLKPGAVVALVGQLGAGKTHFSQGLCEGLGVAASEVTSPTFSLLNEYEGAKCPVFHLDFYRLKDVSELDGIGWDDVLDAGGVVIIEWADMFKEIFPPHTVWVELEYTDNGRMMRVRSEGEVL